MNHVLVPKNFRVGGAGKSGLLDGVSFKGVYCGPVQRLHGQTAMLRHSTTAGEVLAQFDTASLLHNKRALGFGWHRFNSDHFKLINE